MKKLLLSVSVLLMVACQSAGDEKEIGTDVVSNTASADGTENANLPVLKFDEEEFDFGKITQGEKVSHEFHFTNTGKSNLIISGASGSCGCTVPEYPEKPIAPGEKGVINVVFSSEGKRGQQEKTVTVVTNCEPATKIIRIKTDVIVAETAQ